jgi:RNA polymerase sigma-70 factor (ECF subfamily)
MKKETEAAWIALVSEHQQKVLRVAFSYTKNWHDAEEIAQEVFMKLIRKHSEFQGQSEWFTWVYRITVNHCIDFLRKKMRRPWFWLWKSSSETGRDPLENMPSHEKLEDTLDQREIQSALDREITKLPEKQRAVFTLFYREGLKIEAVANILNLSPGTIKAHLFQAREKLKTRLSDFWHTEEASL